MRYKKGENLMVLWEKERYQDEVPVITVVHFEHPETREPIHIITPELRDEAWDLMNYIKDYAGDNGIVCVTCSVEMAIGSKTMHHIGFRNRVWSKYSRGAADKCVYHRHHMEHGKKHRDEMMLGEILDFEFDPDHDQDELF